MKTTHARKNSRFKASLDMIYDYIYDHHEQPKDMEFYRTIFPLPEMNDYALSKRVEKNEHS
jgi:hypothetical protein